MAYFDHRVDDCSRCGDRAPSVVTDVDVSNGVGWSEDDARPLCFDCYLEVVDGHRGLARIETSGGSVVVAADTVESARETTMKLDDSPASTVFDGFTVEPAEETFESCFDGEGAFSPYYVREVVRGVDSEVRHIYRSTSPDGSVVDVRSHLERSTRGKLEDACFAALREPAEDVETKSDLRRLTRTGDSPSPVLARHGALRRVERRLWSYLKQSGALSNSSLTSAENQESGREFERFFEELCRERGLTPHRPASSALRELYPGVHDALRRKFDERLAGVPDYFVEADGHRGFGDRWRPTLDCFVEVKRGDSRMSRRQSKMAAHLKSHGFPVYVLRGEPDSHRFERR